MLPRKVDARTLFLFCARKDSLCYLWGYCKGESTSFITFYKNSINDRAIELFDLYLILSASKITSGVPVVAQWLTNLISMRRHVWSLASLSGVRIRHCCELWCRLAALAPIQSLAWELPYSTSTALNKTNKQKSKILRNKSNQGWSRLINWKL